jgi:hypothetical protein
MFDSPSQLFYLLPGILSLAYALFALLRGKVLGRESQWGWGTQTYTPENIFAFPFYLSLYLTFSAIFILFGFQQSEALLLPYVIFTGTAALIARFAAIWIVSFTVVFFLSQVRRIITKQ